ncbi:MAG: AAA family ATPase, partial [Candidatus Cloacimonetes bacterium]|nr:AAA family ATPase [Candidatus Cloacimonadota bacterium]
EKKQGKVVLILGESGVGKSKLIQHFYYYLQFQDVDFYYSVCKSVEHSFEPLLSIFEEILTLKTETEKLQHFGKFGWDLVKFGILTEKDWMKKIEKPVELSGKNAEIRLLSAMTNFIQKTAEKPIVICLDDLQWADEVILKWLIYAERNLKEFPVLIAGLHRTEQLIEDSVVLKIENLIRIRIKNLKDVDVSDMIKSMLGKKSSSKELNNFIQSIVSHSKGNPLFIREILYYLQEKGKITIENNKWSFPRELEIKNLPSDIHRIILERIHELSREALITLQTASIIGKKFSFEMLLNMTGKSEKELLDDLIDCREVSLIEESGNDYIFIHDKVRE